MITSEPAAFAHPFVAMRLAPARRWLAVLRRGVSVLGASVLAACATSSPKVLTASDLATRAEVQDYLDELRFFHARFTQSGSDGDAEGILWLARPGRLRVEYVEPRPRLMLANHGRLLVADQVTGATTTMPVSNTPLDILLGDKVDLSGAVTVTALQRQPGALQLSLIKTGAPNQGRLTLQFTTPPLALTGVVVQDAAGHTNTLRLFGLFRDTTVDPAMFHYHPAAAPAG
ncbi:MAG: outer membrane lipoprotein carrier protein LolA [Rhodospirillales bacterium]